jgi:hypothetical protein
VKNLDKLSKGERFIVDWQYHMAGDFATALVGAIMMADTWNKHRDGLSL